MSSSSRSISFRTRMVALAASSGMLLGGAAVVAPTAMAKPPVSEKGNDMQCQSPRNVHPLKNRGNQIITVDGENAPGIATGGSMITINGYGFTEPAEDRPGFKINDHSPEDEDTEPFWGAQPAGTGMEISPDGRSLIPVKDDLLPDKNGRFSLQVKLPKAGTKPTEIGNGMNWIRVVSATPYFSHYALFLVVSDEVAEASKNTRVTVGELKEQGGKQVSVISGKGFDPNAKVELTFNCTSLGTVTADAQGAFSEAFEIPGKLIEDRYDRQVIARQKSADASATLQKAAVGYSTDTPGGNDNKIEIPESAKVDVEDANKLTDAQVEAVLALAKKYIPFNGSYTYNKKTRQVEIFTAGNNQTRYYDLDMFANVKTTSSETPDEPEKGDPKKDDEPEKQGNSGSASSPIMKIVIALVALLGLGAAAFGAYNWARSQGLVR